MYDTTNNIVNTTKLRNTASSIAVPEMESNRKISNDTVEMNRNNIVLDNSV